MIGGFVTLAIVVIVIIICKNKNKREGEKFKTALSSHFAEFSNRTDYFENIFEMIMEHEGVQKESVDKILQELPTYKEQFTRACDKLIALSEHNVCLFSKEKRDKTDFTHLRRDSITRDTIEVLPALGEYFKWYNTLYKDIHKELLLKKFCFRINDMAFGRVFAKESEYSSKEDYDKAMQAFAQTIDNFFQEEIRTVVKQFLGIEAHVDLKDTGDVRIRMIAPKINPLMKLAQEYSEQEDLFANFFAIWVTKMQQIGKKYAAAHLDLVDYFDKIEAKMKEHIENYFLYDTSMVWILNCWAPRLDEKTPEECLRVLELYKSGSLSGVYYGRHSEAGV